MRLRFSVLEGPLAGRSFDFAEHASFVVGRDAPNGLSIPGDERVSRHHCVIEVAPPRAHVRDLGSRNGTFVNDHQVHEAELFPGDRVRVGRTVSTARILLHEARAVAALSANDLETARGELSGALRLGAHNAQPWVALARAWFERTEHQPAVSAAEQALRLDPDAVAAVQLRGLALLRQGQLKEALPDIERALARAPLDVTTWTMVAALADLDHVAADELFRRLLDEAERPPVIGLVTRARTRDAFGDLRGALADLDRALAIAPERLDIRHARSKVRARLRDLAGALEDLEVVAAGSAPSFDIFGQRAGLRYSLGDHAEALEDATAALALWDAPGTRLLRGLVLLELGERGAAIDDFSSALARDPSMALARLERARARAALGDASSARADLEELLRLGPDSVLARDARALLEQLERRGR